MHGRDPSKDLNPFKNIEMALTEAKQKIAKMQQTPQILEALPDVSQATVYIFLLERQEETVPQS
jgi:ABC-type dipeptide/oligopeptide/nickel transport system ATPase subunit